MVYVQMFNNLAGAQCKSTDKEKKNPCIYLTISF